MKRFLHLTSTVVVMTLILAACNFPIIPVTGGSADPTEPPVNVTEPPASATLVPVDLAGPPMIVGSKYPYVDGTLIMAVPGGPFIMGYGAADNPIHEVELSDFWVYSTKVTNQQYALCVRTGNCTPPNKKNNPVFENSGYINFPVTGVSFEQASQYCTFVHGRLPTEAQWEKAARGPEGNIFPWGDEAPACNLLNSLFCVGKITEILTYKNGVSFYGALDMAGNTREWVSDWYSPTYYNESPATDPLGPDLGERRSVRGSSYQDVDDVSISAHRFSLAPTDDLPDLGFRCIVEEPVYYAPMCEQLAFIGVGPDGSGTECKPDIKCNDVSVSQNALCTPRLQPYTIVSFGLTDTPPDGWLYDVPGCSQIPDTAKYQCSPPGPLTATVTGACVGTNSCASACPVGYTKNGDDVCQWDGAPSIGTACMPGMTYDPLIQCCSANPDSAVDFKLCPAGSYPLDGACIADPTYIAEMESLDVIFNSCEPPKQVEDEPDPVCSLTCDSSYPSCETLDVATCTCVGKAYSCG